MQETVTFQGQQVIEIKNGQASVRVAPQYGARLLDWQVRGESIIPWPENANWEKAGSVRGGNPILFPFIARHMVNGEIGWWIDSQGTKRALPMHGFARTSSFKVIPEADPTVLRMSLESTPQTREGYPFDFIFDVVYKLGPDSLESRLEVTNTGSQPMPYYSGHHFYFTVPHGEREQWQVQIPCERRGRQTPDGSIPEKPATTDLFELSDQDVIDSMQISLKKPEVTLQNKNSGQGVTFDLDVAGSIPWYAVTTWTETPESDFYCVEPWTGLPNAIHHGKGLRWLAPGAKESAICVLHAKV